MQEVTTQVSTTNRVGARNARHMEAAARCSRLHMASKEPPAPAKGPAQFGREENVQVARVSPPARKGIAAGAWTASTAMGKAPPARRAARRADAPACQPVAPDRKPGAGSKRDGLPMFVPPPTRMVEPFGRLATALVGTAAWARVDVPTPAQGSTGNSNIWAPAGLVDTDAASKPSAV